MAKERARRCAAEAHASAVVRLELSLSSKVVLLASSAGVLVHVPLDVTILVLESAGSDLEQTHRHARTDFCQFDALVSGLDEDVVADLDAIVNVLECDDTRAKFG
ncbi:hypothetical protein KCU83_g73, partial [Aureobasidium melanogenum]